jgi:DNA polymerase-3 subunit delta'
MGRTISWRNLVGQNRIKETFSTAFENNSLGHAYLFSGDPGAGKFQAALELALAVHCDNDGETPCYNCNSCRQVLAYSYTDFHCLFPVALKPAHTISGDSSKLSEEGWNFIAEETRKKLNDPYALNESRLRNLPVAWIRELNHSIMRGTVKGKTNVVIICDVDIMQKGSANAMLKTLEEPPPHTIILLLTSRLYSVLPTIRSRCQIVRFGSITPEEIAASLAKEYSKDVKDPEIIYAVECATGSYGKAKSLIDDSQEVFTEQAHILWELCIKNRSWNELTGAIEKVNDEYLGGGWDYVAAERLLISFLHIIRKTFFGNISGTEKYIMGSDVSSEAHDFGIQAADRLYVSGEKAVSAIRARSNVLLVLVSFVLSVLEIIHGEN